MVYLGRWPGLAPLVAQGGALSQVGARGLGSVRPAHLAPVHT